MKTTLEEQESHKNLWDEMMGFLLMRNITMLIKTVSSFHQYCLADLMVNLTVCAKYANSSISLVVKYEE